MAILRLIRLPNLIIVGLTQYLLYHTLLKSSFQRNQIHFALNEFDFSIFLLVTIIITACGYIINDIHDYRIDALNRPSKVIVNRLIAIQTAFWIYFILNLIGFILALYLAFQVKNLFLVNLFPLATAFLYLYSNRLKNVVFLGNFWISAFCMGVAGIIWFAERKGIQELSQLAPKEAYKIQAVFLLFMVFAFLTTFIREIVKDMEDLVGDKQGNRQTIPIKWGILTAKKIAFSLGLLLVFALVSFAFFAQINFPNLWLILLLSLNTFLVLLVFWQLYYANNKEAYYNISQLLKVIILLGTLFIWFIKI